MEREDDRATNEAIESLRIYCSDLFAALWGSACCRQ